MNVEALWSTINLLYSGSMLFYLLILKKMGYDFVLKPKDWKCAQFFGRALLRYSQTSVDRSVDR
jgi:hypothetical protein